MFGQHNDESPQNDTTLAPHSDGLVTPTAGSGASDSAQTWQHPGSPLGNDSQQPTHVSDPTTSSPTLPSDGDNDVLPAHSGNDDLVTIKQQALTQLSPLVGHLDQTPEEKFRTTMMMIQASDDQSLVKTAYEAAQKIEDEKTRAQALLDIVNEINYFTQHTQN